MLKKYIFSFYGGIMKKTLLAILIAVMLVCSVPALAQDNVLHTYVDRVFRTFSQIEGSDGHLFIVLGSLSEGLLRLDENHNPQPALAESYTVVGYAVSYPSSAFSDIILAAWKWPGEVYLHHGNQQML